MTGTVTATIIRYTPNTSARAIQETPATAAAAVVVNNTINTTARRIELRWIPLLLLLSLLLRYTWRRKRGRRHFFGESG